MKHQITIAIICFLSVFASAQEVSFTAQLDTNTILIGEQTTYTLRAKSIRDVEAGIIWPQFPDTLKSLEIISSSFDTTEQSSSLTITQNLVITAWDSGFVVIPPLVLVAENEEHETEPIILNISTVQLNPDQDFYDIKQPVNPPIDWIYWLKRLWFVLVLASLLVAALLWFWLRKRKERQAEEIIIDHRTPAQRAKDILYEIRDKRIWQEGSVKTYYSVVTDTVRTYLEESYPVAAMEMVSDELLDAMQTQISAQAQQTLREMLRTADMVKFAKAKPGPDQHAQLWDSAIALIELTEPKTEKHHD